MADVAPVAHIGENSPEQVAYKLMQAVAEAESKLLKSSLAGEANVDRKWILDTYAECLDTVTGHRIYARDM